MDENREVVVKYTYDSWGVPKEYLKNQTTGEWEEVEVGTFNPPGGEARQGGHSHPTHGE